MWMREISSQRYHSWVKLKWNPFNYEMDSCPKQTQKHLSQEGSDIMWSLWHPWAWMCELPTVWLRLITLRDTLDHCLTQSMRNFAEFVAFLLIFHLLNTSSPLCFSHGHRSEQQTESIPVSVSSYFLIPYFRAQSGCCTGVRNDLTCSVVPEIDSSEFNTLWLQLASFSHTKYVCAVYLSPHIINFPKCIDYHTS